MSILLRCPFGCGWAAPEVPPGRDDDLLPEDPRERLRWHLRVEHGAHADRDQVAWQDGAWEVALKGSLGPRVSLDLEDEQDQ